MANPKTKNCDEMMDMIDIYIDKQIQTVKRMGIDFQNHVLLLEEKLKESGYGGYGGYNEKKLCYIKWMHICI